MNVWYMNGAGNDFAVIDARGLSLDFPQLSKELCKLTGADGFMAVDTSATADFKLHFYNADGSRGEMCGNGSRCICRFAYELGIAGETMTVETDAGLVSGKRLSESQYLVRLNNPSIVDLNRKGDVSYVELGNPGVPHAVTQLTGFVWRERNGLMAHVKQLRHDPAFPKGANVNIYTWLNSHTIRILTYERGVEDFTLACGTGSAATAVVLWTQGLLPEGKLTVKNPGGKLSVTIEGRDGVIDAIWLEGPTEIVKTFEV